MDVKEEGDTGSSGYCLTGCNATGDPHRLAARGVKQNTSGDRSV